MKAITLIIFLFFITSVSFAQAPNYTIELQKGINQLDTVKSTSGYTSVIHHFEKIETTPQWLPQYYAAYSNLIAGIRGNQDEETKDAIYDNATFLPTKPIR